MRYTPPVAWLQLRKDKRRLVVAISGVAFAVVLVFMQMGFRTALFDSAVRYHRYFDYDLVLISQETSYIVRAATFSRRRLYQAAAFPGVESIAPVYIGLGIWENPFNNKTRRIFVLGLNPARSVLAVEGVQSNLKVIQMPDVVLFDQGSRPEYGAVAEALRSGESVVTEVNNREVSVRGLFEVGTSFGIDGTLVTSDLNFQRLFPYQSAGLINLGLINLEQGADIHALQEALSAQLPNDVLVLTKQQYADREVDFWSSSTPIGYIFTFGVVVGLVVGAIIVYQILFSDVAEHLQEYATLRAMGHPMSYLLGIVLREALLLAILGFVPGFLVSVGLYGMASDATQLPLEMGVERALSVLGLTIGMCAISGAAAVRKLRSADPADIF
jgi:putative ABC transport system permease protein